MTDEFRGRLRNLNAQARWLIAIGAGLVLLLITAGCSLVGALMLTFSSEACRDAPSAMNFFFLLPPGMMTLGAILAPVLFGLRVRLPWVVAALAITWGLSTLLYIAWLPIVSTIC